MQKWEYNVVVFRMLDQAGHQDISRGNIPLMNDLGGKGWELVSAFPQHYTNATPGGALIAEDYIGVFRRPGALRQSMF